MTSTPELEIGFILAGDQNSEGFKATVSTAILSVLMRRPNITRPALVSDLKRLGIEEHTAERFLTILVSPSLLSFINEWTSPKTRCKHLNLNRAKMNEIDAFIEESTRAFPCLKRLACPSISSVKDHKMKILDGVPQKVSLFLRPKHAL